MDVFGIWVAALLTLALYSFLYNDNPVYKLAEHLFVGVSAGYMVPIAWWQILKPNLIEPFQAGPSGFEGFMLVFGLVFGLMYLTRFFPNIAWMSRWPIALSVGFGAGIALTAEMQSNIIKQLHGSMLSLNPGTEVFVPATGELVKQGWAGIATSPDAWMVFGSSGGVINNAIIVFGLVACLAYFFFSIKHEGAMGVTARAGIWFLMISFGASFGFTVMARISLLIGRMQFLLGDWLGTMHINLIGM
ncbi:MAG: hypothetical protein D6675_05620 [Gemmatimonadetes bacterium]|nr:MAG: hypothetical protein D6675_05620 [Gemmatimonadota bacterium]